MHDLRYALRLIRQNWPFSLTVIAILALCVGANTAVLAVVNSAMIRPLPYPQPERLAQVVRVFRDEGNSDEHDNHDGRTWEAIRDRVSALDATVYSDWVTGVNLGVEGNGAYVQQQRVSSGFFRVLGVSPLVGREFNADEDRAGGPSVVMLSHAVWHKYFHEDTAIVGRRVVLRGEPFTIVGVMPAGFRTAVKADVWTPIRPSTTGEGSGGNYAIAARLRNGASWRQASEELASLVPDLKKAGSYAKDADVRLGVIPLLEGRTSDLRRPLMLLWAAVGFVFVLGCVNIGGMLLARASGRVGEIATRLALGAPFSRIVRQLLIESVSLGLFGGLAGALVGWGALTALREFGALTFPFLETVELDWRVLAATLALTLLAGIAFGLAPAFHAARVDLRAVQSSRSVSGHRRFFSLGALAGGQVALTVPLLFGAGLLLHSFLHLWNLDPGFDPNHVMIAKFSLQDARYKTPAQMNRLYDTAITRLHQTPGIEAAAVGLTLPYERALNMPFHPSGRENVENTNVTYVTPEFFTALRIPLLQGRVLAQTDGPASAQVAVVNQAFVKRYLNNAEPLGQLLRFGRGAKGPQIIGVVGDVQDQRAGWGDFGPIAHIPMVYIPASQWEMIELVHSWFSPKWVVRSSLDGAAVAKAIEDATRSADPLLPMAAFESVRDLKADALTFERFLAVLSGTIAALAMLLSAMGIDGLISNVVTERTRELGIRMALGSTLGGAIEVALRPGLIWVLAGVATGAAAAFGLERFLKSFLWGVQPGDPVSLIGVGLGLLFATALASLIPAARIARLNPADTLRSE
ncbi:MAG TPA: ABC transporter permease [Bryobacteraceae bacterium]|nr:ABC transporter permease [Bryobacteraceae bacterium]